MFASDIFEEVKTHPRATQDVKSHPEKPVSIHVELSVRLRGARRMHWNSHESEIMARVWSEMDKPRLTKSVREALEAAGEQAPEPLEHYSRIA
jgi:hypothetical protein